MIKNIILLLIISSLLFISCTEDYQPKPKGFLRLAYNDAAYQKTTSDCPYSFEYAKHAIEKKNNKCWVNIEYPGLKGALNITYRPIENNLNELLKEAEKLTYKHSVKADGISAQPFLNSDKKVYGKLLEVTGDAASSLQFHLTDSTKHFLTGALYFEVQPNYDSILPAIKHIEKDIKHLMETLEWNN